MELSGLFMSQDFISLLEEDFYTHHGKYIPKLIRPGHFKNA